jgi:hypothetical protein
MDDRQAQEIIEHASNLAYLLRHNDFTVNAETAAQMERLFAPLDQLQRLLKRVVTYLAEEV